MKDSGVPWLGEVPEQWERRRLKSLLRPIDRRSASGTETLLSLRRDHGIVVYSDHFSRPAQGATTVGYKIVNKGQLVLNRLQANNGLVFDSSLDGLVSPDYSVFEPREQVSVRYLSLLLRTNTYRDHFRRESTGLGTGSAGFLRLYDDRFLETPVVLPTTGEQSSILRFLDHADRRIRHYISGKQRLIGLLDEQKQAIIHRAVTRGLDPDIRLKPSGVEWLGDVPHHWHVLPLRRRWSVTDCKHLTVPFVDSGIPLASVREVQTFEVRLAQAKRTTEDWFRLLIEGNRRPRRGDLIYCRNVSIGASAVVETDEAFAMGQDVCLIRSRNQSQRFLNYFLKSPAMARQLALLKVGSTFDRINVAEVKSLVVVIPPPEEQHVIARALDDSLAASERAIGRVRSEQDLLREFRTRLIADVMTGKLDVREAAARLPEETEQPEPLDEIEPESEVKAEDGEAADQEAEA
jgi:type I restriction enzyme, S subunit